MNRKSFLEGFLAALVLAFVILGGVLFYFYEKGSSIEDSDRGQDSLKSALTDLEKKSGVRCADVRSHIEDILSTKIDPTIQLFKSGGDWRANVDADLSERMNKIADVAMQCNIYRKFMGADRTEEIPEAAVRQFARIESLVRYGLTAEKCDRACLAGQFAIVEKARDQLKLSLEQR